MMTNIHNFVLGKGHTVDLDSADCVIWPFRIGPNGYGYKGDRALSPGKRTYLAHRWVWIKVYGAIPDGLTIDHVYTAGCRSRACVSLRHLELVTQRENVVRALAHRDPKATCDNGHDLTLPDGRQSAGARWRCRICIGDRQRKWAADHPTWRRDYMRAYRQKIRSKPPVGSPDRMPGGAGQ